MKKISCIECGAKNKTHSEIKESELIQLWQDL